ncbi:MAG TPA: glycine cleavage T C-terminal barrel domain-containing protein [Candidatus Binatia bacterium]|jgi:folate-binding protein YgfZ|nr:glycine cleavage T C-terminal barrel domain-containing protein [Candidatus Binatia bacterium]
MVQTALHDHAPARGVAEMEDRGVRLPAHYGDAAAEYRALRAGAAIVDLGFRTLVRAVGADRVTFLQGMLTNDLAGLAAGQGCPALLLTIQGRVVADVRVAALADALLLDVDVRVRDAFVGALEKLVVADEIELVPPVEPTALLGLEGPGAETVLGGTAAPALEPFAHVEIDVAGVAVRAVRVSEVRGPGFVLHVPATRAAAVWDALVAAGARPCGMEALEGRRVEVGVPRIGLDMDGSTLALEVPVAEAISERKGCYLGQEVVARGTARGHVNRRLVGLLLDGPRPRRGVPLVYEGREAGHVTSVGRAFALGRDAALGFVRREHWSVGTTLEVRDGSATAVATVTAWPLA